MMKSFRSHTIGGLIIALTMAVGPAQASGDRDGVAKAAAQFYVALNTMFEGDNSAMEAVWSHADDVLYMGPDGTQLVGWEDVRASWRKQAAMKLGGRVVAEDMQITVGRDLAVVSNFEKGANIVDGAEQAVSIRSTKVFRKENGTWKLHSHHTDPLPFLKSGSSKLD